MNGDYMKNACGYAVTDKDGEQQPCDRPATGWRWYQDVGEHEDLLDVACDHHANEGGRRIHDLEAQLLKVEALATGAVEVPVRVYDDPSRDFSRGALAAAQAFRDVLHTALRTQQ